MPRDYFKGRGAHGPAGNLALLRRWPEVGETLLYAGELVQVVRVVKSECAADISGASLPGGNGRVGLGWLLQHNVRANLDPTAL